MSSSAVFDNLYPAIIQCFAIIFAGYLFGRLGIITTSTAKGLESYISYLALPALLFQAMCTLKFEVVNWWFLLAIAIAKSSVFLLVAVFTLVLGRNFGKAGLFAIFATQSNDFALGYPIVKAIYGASRPELLSYIYLLAPISVAILNPLGFTLMEVQKNIDSTEARSRCRSVLQVIKGVISKPIIFMMMIGIAANFAFHQTVPPVLSGILNVLGESFSATALFYLGLSMVGKISQQARFAFIVPAILVAVKTLLLPFVARELVVGLQVGGNDTNMTEEFRDYGFLYGTFPVAPSVFIFAANYGLATEVVGPGLVVCTFLSAPVMFMSAQMSSLSMDTQTNLMALVTRTAFDVSIIGLIFCVWVLAVFFLSGKFKQLPHKLTTCLVISQVLGCVGMILFYTLGYTHSVNTWQVYLSASVMLIGTISCRTWTAGLAVGLFLLKKEGTDFVSRNIGLFHIASWGTPILLTGVLFIVRSFTGTTCEQPMHDSCQRITMTGVLTVCILVTVGSLVTLQRLGHLRSARQDNKDYREVPGPRRELRDQCQNHNNCCTNPDEECPLLTSTEPGLQRQDLHRSRTSQGIFSYQSLSSESLMPGAGDGYQLDEEEQVSESHDHQVSRHVVLLICLTLSMIIELFLCIWRLIMDNMEGIYIELEFLNSVLNYAQGFFAFVAFGLDTEMIFHPLIRKYVEMRRSSSPINSPN
ncbi:PREDICTED: integral membrane protein GPR155-like [Branchiostoma belcheri]|uniref:Integral membrane protein GPR155-like n=1 Tax=Branchiostoma belcheri TaxID=7741 RepID=A0A6P5A381_BRABE|nr:PREDICTED: integral membrane protein GPR155-like [Branchiostoma belcheri]XP_019636196.1 PREDICTED: integral membrane protein GPR155-like [Branchiostoma belcheri]